MANTQYRPLDTDWTDSRNTHFKQLKRVGDVALFQRTTGTRKPEYEVFVVKRVETAQYYGKTIEAYEAYPGNAAFGHHAAFCNNFTDALHRFDAFVATSDERKAADLKAAETGSAAKRRGRPKKIQPVVVP